MIKLYFKKLFFTLLFLGGFYILGAIFAFFWHLIFRNLFSESVSTVACFALGSILNFKLAYMARYELSSYKMEYINAFTSDAFLFVKDYKNTFKSKENIIHTSAFLTIELIFNLATAISTSTPFLRLVIVTILLLFVEGLIFSTLNTLIWCLVHKKWMRFLKWKVS